jgi:hypothetical protein
LSYSIGRRYKKRKKDESKCRCKGALISHLASLSG